MSSGFNSPALSGQAPVVQVPSMFWPLRASYKGGNKPHTRWKLVSASRIAEKSLSEFILVFNTNSAVLVRA